MGYRTDWVAAFPFEAVGLTNKYESEMTAISRSRVRLRQGVCGGGWREKVAGAGSGGRRVKRFRRQEERLTVDEERRRFQRFSRGSFRSGAHLRRRRLKK